MCWFTPKYLNNFIVKACGKYFGKLGEKMLPREWSDDSCSWIVSGARGAERILPSFLGCKVDGERLILSALKTVLMYHKAEFAPLAVFPIWSTW